MARIYRCDRCETPMDEPTIALQLTIELVPDDDDDDDDLLDDELVEHHFCTMNCLAEWAMAEALEAINQ